MVEWIEDLASELHIHANEARASAQSTYMKHRFVFYGIEAAVRKDIAKLWIQKFKLKSIEGKDKRALVIALFQLEQREFHYIAIDFLNSLKPAEIEVSDGIFLETLITMHSWWDSVDAIASNYLGKYVKKYPVEGLDLMRNWSKSEHLWLMRSTLIFQLKYGKETDFEFLKERIHQFNTINEFFIQKAIGWSLRQYSKFNKDRVRYFISEIELSNLTRREASKYL